MKTSTHPDNRRIDVWAAGDSAYELFVPSFIWSVLRSNPSAFCWVGVENPAAASDRFEPGLAFIRAQYGDRFRLVEADFAGPAKAGSVRFLDYPAFESEFVYFTDLDFIFTSDLLAQHEPWLEKSGLPFNNVVRPGTTRLSGLHFTRRDALWPSREKGLEVPDEVLKGNDEELLYWLVSNVSGMPLSKEMGTSRPAPGLHASVFSRFPFPTISPVTGGKWIGWGGCSPQAALEVLDSAETRAFEQTLSHAARLPLIWGRMWALSVRAKEQGQIEPDRVPTLTGRLATIRGALAKSAEADVSNKQVFAKEIDFIAPSSSAGNIREERFREIWKQNSLKGAESRSGPSSGMARTEKIRKSIPSLLNDLGVTKIVDAPCGDFYWMRHVAQECENIEFSAIDIVPELIAENQHRFSELANVRFSQADLLMGELPHADLTISRDFLFHLSFADCKLFLKNFLSSGTPWLLTTSHLPGAWANSDISTGGWRYIDLMTTPYNFPEPVAKLDDGEDRFLLLFHRAEIESLRFLT